MKAGLWFGMGLTFVILGVLNLVATDDGLVRILLAGFIGLGTGAIGGAIDEWVGRLAA